MTAALTAMANGQGAIAIMSTLCPRPCARALQRTDFFHSCSACRKEQHHDRTPAGHILEPGAGRPVNRPGAPKGNMPVLRSSQRGVCLCFDPVKGEYACVAIQSKRNMPVL